MEHYLLDACALLTFLNDEDGAEIVESLLQKAEDGEIAVSMSIINMLEVYYDRARSKKIAEVGHFLAFTQTAPIAVINSISGFVYHEAARLKASYKMSLADAIGLATAKELSALFVTSDHAEIEPVAQREPVSILWLPAKPRNEKSA